MVEAVKTPPVSRSVAGVAIKVLCGGSLTLCIESVEFEFDPVKKLDKVKKKGLYLDLPSGPAIRVTDANVKHYGFESVAKMVSYLKEQLPKTADGRKSGPAFMYSVILGKQTTEIDAMETGLLKSEIEARTGCKPAPELTREKAIVALRALREICGENVAIVPVAPSVTTRAEAQKKERTLMEDMFARFSNTAGKP